MSSVQAGCAISRLVAPPQALDLLGKILAIEVGKTTFAQQRALLGAPLSIVRFVGRRGPCKRSILFIGA